MKYWLDTNKMSKDDIEIVTCNAHILKPFPACETCPKWKTIECTMSKLLSDTLRNSRHKWAELIYPNSDYFCKDHPDFNQS